MWVLIGLLVLLFVVAVILSESGPVKRRRQRNHGRRTVDGGFAGTGVYWGADGGSHHGDAGGGSWGGGDFGGGDGGGG